MEALLPAPEQPKTAIPTDTDSLEQLMTGSQSEPITDEHPSIPEQPSSVSPEAKQVQTNTPDYEIVRHRAPEPSLWARYNPAQLARRADVTLRSVNINPEKIRQSLPYAAALGSLAVGAVSIYVSTRHNIELPGFSHSHNHNAASDGNATWHDANTSQDTTANNAEHVDTAPSATDTVAPSYDRSLIVDAQNSDTRQAFSHDAALGNHSSNVSDWSQQAIENAAIKAGLSPDQAHTLASDPNNVSLANNAFYQDNSAVGHDAHHYMNAGDTYNTHGQNQAADSIVGQWKSEHMPAADQGSVPAADSGSSPTTESSQPDLVDGGNANPPLTNELPVAFGQDVSKNWVDHNAEDISNLGYMAATYAATSATRNATLAADASGSSTAPKRRKDKKNRPTSHRSSRKRPSYFSTRDDATNKVVVQSN